MMRGVNKIMTAGFDILLMPLRTESPWPGMLAASLLAALVATTILKWTSNPHAIRRRRDRAIARVLEMALFRHDPVMTLSEGAVCQHGRSAGTGWAGATSTGSAPNAAVARKRLRRNLLTPATAP